jgi:hypothetical protein
MRGTHMWAMGKCRGYRTSAVHTVVPTNNANVVSTPRGDESTHLSWHAQQNLQDQKHGYSNLHQSQSQKTHLVTQSCDQQHDQPNRDQPHVNTNNEHCYPKSSRNYQKRQTYKIVKQSAKDAKSYNIPNESPKSTPSTA